MENVTLSQILSEIETLTGVINTLCPMVESELNKSVTTKSLARIKVLIEKLDNIN